MISGSLSYHRVGRGRRTLWRTTLVILPASVLLFLVFALPQRFSPGVSQVLAATGGNVLAGLPNTVLAPTAGPDLTIDKVHTGEFGINQPGLYAISVTNVSTDTAVTGPITVTDTLPAGLTYSSFSGADWTCTPNAQVVTCRNENASGLPPSGSSSIGLTVTVGQGAAPSVTNTATVINASDINPNNNTDTDPTTVVSADLAVTKSVSSATVDVGDAITYTIRISNLGPSIAPGVILTDTLPTGITFRNGSGPVGSTYNTSNGRWSGLGDLTVGGAVTLTLSATVNPNTYGQTITNATNGVFSTIYDYNASNNTGTASFRVVAPDILRVTKTDSKTTVNPGETYTYTITVDNLGTTNLTEYTITDTLSSYLTIITDTMGVARQNPGSGDTFVWDITDDLADGDGRDYFVRVRVDSTLPGSLTSIVNTVRVGSSIPEANLANNTATDTDTASGTRSVSISNSVSPISIQTGQNATYTIRVTNNGSASVTDVVVTDTFSQFVDVSSASTNRGNRTISSRTVTVNVGTLSAGQSATITVVVRANSVATANTTVSNTASMSYKFGTITYTGSATASFSLIRSTTTLPGTGGIELSRLSSQQPPNVFYIAIVSAMVLAALGLAIFGYGLWARIRQSDWSGWAMRMGLMFISTALLFGLAAWGIAAVVNLVPQPTLVALLNSDKKDVPARATEEDPPWVGHAPEGEPEVLPDFPIPEPTNVPPDEHGNEPDTSPVNRIVLSSIGVDTVVKYVPYDGFTWLIAGLQQEIAWMGDTSWPGLGGNTGLAGHVSLRNGRDGPFRYLDSLQPSDQIKLYTEENIYTYSVREKQVVTDTDFAVIEPTQSPQLTLITCTNWDPGTGFYKDRLIVFADLVNVEPVKKTTQGNLEGMIWNPP